MPAARPIEPLDDPVQPAVYENPWIAVREDQVLRPDGQPGIYGVVHFKNRAVGVLPVDDDGRVWLVGQHRYPLDAYSWEIPEGGGPEAETPRRPPSASSARRPACRRPARARRPRRTSRTRSATRSPTSSAPPS